MEVDAQAVVDRLKVRIGELTVQVAMLEVQLEQMTAAAFVNATSVNGEKPPASDDQHVRASSQSV